MSNSPGLCISFKAEVLAGIHVLGTDVLKAALYLATATIGPSTTAYTVTGEVSGTNYTAGGIVVTTATAPSVNSTSGVFTPSASVIYTNVTLATSFDTLLLYNSSKANRAIGVYQFTAQTVAATNFRLDMPVNGIGTALVEYS